MANELMSSDEAYKAGYQDGIDQAAYVSDYQVDEVEVVVSYDDKVITYSYFGENGIMIISRKFFEEFARDSLPEGWRAEFVQR